jgi:hypothetical protein
VPQEVGVGERGRCLHPAAGAARELPRRGWGALDDRRDLIEWHGEDVVEDEGEPLGGSERVEDDEQRQPDRVGEQRLLLGVDAVLGADDRVGHVRAERLLGPGARDLMVFRHTRATIVVSQPRRFSMPPLSARLTRSQVSWTASSASLSEPSIR